MIRIEVINTFPYFIAEYKAITEVTNTHRHSALEWKKFERSWAGHKERFKAENDEKISRTNLKNRFLS